MEAENNLSQAIIKPRMFSLFRTIARKGFSRLGAFSLVLTGQFAKDTTVLSLGTVTAQFISSVATPVLTRIYTPFDFGVYAVFAAVSGILTTGLTLRYDAAILLPKREEESLSIVQLCLLLSGTIGGILLLFAFFVPPKWQSIMRLDGLEGWLPLVILTGIGGAWISIVIGWLNRRAEYIEISKLRIAQSLLTVVMSLGLGLAGVTTGQLIGLFFGILVLVIFLLFKENSFLKHWRFSAIRDVAYCHSAMPRLLFPCNLIDMVTQQLPVFMITFYYSSNDAGQFSLAWKVLAMPLALIGGAIGQVFFQRISLDVHNGLEMIRQRYIKISLALSLIALFLVLFFFNYGEVVFKWLFGPQWAEAGKISRWLVLSMSMYFVSSPISTILLVLKKQKISLIFSFFQLFYRVGAILISPDVLSYVFFLVLCEVVTVILFELCIVYLLFYKNIDVGDRNV